jgi:alpha-L-arabinofuranosidase
MPTVMQARDATITIEVSEEGKAISPSLFGIFFEDTNHAADGGLYAELIQNRAFGYKETARLSWNAFTSWELFRRGGGRGSVAIEEAVPLHPNNPKYVVLNIDHVGEGVGLMNPGYGGIPLREGESYRFSVFAAQLYMDQRWGGPGIEGRPMPVTVRLETPEGEVLGESAFEVRGHDWTRVERAVVATGSHPAARLVLLGMARGGVALDVISLFPEETFRNRPNGLRADLAQALADLKPAFVRFPGGCLAHGNGIDPPLPKLLI